MVTNYSFQDVIIRCPWGMSKWELCLLLLFPIVNISKLGWLLHHLPSWNNKLSNGKQYKRRVQLPEPSERVTAVGEGPPSQSCGLRQRRSATDEHDLEAREPGNVPLLTPSSPISVTQWLNPGLVETKRAKGVLPAQRFIGVSLLAQNRVVKSGKSIWRAKWGLSGVIRIFLSLLTRNVSVCRDQVRWEYPSLIWTLNFINI